MTADSPYSFEEIIEAGVIYFVLAVANDDYDEAERAAEAAFEAHARSVLDHA